MKSEKKFDTKTEIAKFVKSIAEAPESPYSGRAKTLYECFLTENPRQPDLIDEVTLDTPTELERYCDLVFRQQDHVVSYNGHLVWPGMPVTVKKGLMRRRIYTNTGLRRKVWAEYDIKFTKAYVIGVRTLYNGRLIFGYDEPNGFKPEDHFQALMVISSLRKKPFYVLEFEIET